MPPEKPHGHDPRLCCVPAAPGLSRRRAEPARLAAHNAPLVVPVQHGREFAGSLAVVAADADVRPGAIIGGRRGLGFVESGLDVVELVGEGFLQADEGAAVVYSEEVELGGEVR